MARTLFTAPLLLLPLLAACGSTHHEKGKAEAKVEAACKLAGLPTALRETLVVIDRSALKPADPKTFRIENEALFTLIDGLSNGEKAIGSGAMAPRERLTITIADPASGTNTQIFTGCVPGLSPEELKGRTDKGEDGLVDRYFGSDTASQLDKQRHDFLNKVLMVLVNAPTADKVRGGEDFATSGLAKLVRLIGPGASQPDLVRRVFLFTDPGPSLLTVPKDWREARIAAFATAEQQQIKLGLADFYLVPANRTPGDVEQAFLDAFFLGAQADLIKVGPFAADKLAKAPAHITRFTGELPLGNASGPAPMELRVATASDGQMVHSWLTYTGINGLRSTPVAGQYVCAAEGSCTLRGDPGLVLGQRWRVDAGTTPQGIANGPLGGMRDISATGDGDKLTGRISDTTIFVGEKGDLNFTVRRAN